MSQIAAVLFRLPPPRAVMFRCAVIVVCKSRTSVRDCSKFTSTIVCEGVSVSVAVFRYGVVVMFVFGCFRISRNVAAGVAAGLVLVLAAPACAPSDQGLPDPDPVSLDRVDSDSVEPVPADVASLDDTVPDPVSNAASVPVADSVTTPVDPSDTVVDPTPVAPTTTIEPTPVATTTTIEPTPVATTTTPAPTTVKPTPVATTTTVKPTPTTVKPTPVAPTTTPAPTTIEPTPVAPTTTIEPTPVATTTTVKPTPVAPAVTPGTVVAPPGVSWFPGRYPVPGTAPLPDPGVTISSITHHDAVWEYGVPEVTFRWTLHLSNGNNVDRSWTPDPGYESTIWSPERIAAGTPFYYHEEWVWDSDPVYGPHPLQGASYARHQRRSITLQSALPASGTRRSQPGILPPSGFMNFSVFGYLHYLGVVPQFYELWYALGSMSVQDQRALYETLQEIEYDAAADPHGTKPNARSDYLIDFLLTTQPRWTCRGDTPCHLT